MWVKVCGLREAENIARVAELPLQMMGFIFSPASPRFAGRLDPRAVKALPEGIRRVGVFVDAPVREVAAIVRRYGLDTVQLHGDETPQVCAVLKEEGFSVVKALGIGSTGDVSAAADYQEVCDVLLFDTKSPRRGGTGRRFDWNLLKEYDGPLPFLLGGGIGPQEVPEIAAFHHPKFLGVDLNSRFETEPGVKDVAALRDFIGRVLPAERE